MDYTCLPKISVRNTPFKPTIKPLCSKIVSNIPGACDSLELHSIPAGHYELVHCFSKSLPSSPKWYLNFNIFTADHRRQLAREHCSSWRWGNQVALLLDLSLRAETKTNRRKQALVGSMICKPFCLVSLLIGW